MRLACVQCDVVYGDPEANFARLERDVRSLAERGVDLIVFPEAFLTGYCAGTREAAWDLTLEATSPVISQIEALAESVGVGIVAGFAERDGDAIRNTALLCEPGVPVRFYRKTHLPWLGMDRFVVPGDVVEVFETRWGTLGLMICFDIRFPELARALALKGADLILVPTNWPTGADVSADLLAPARAVENRVFVATCNRVGIENGFAFIGKSKIIDPSGEILCGVETGEGILVADLDLTGAREKKIVRIPGQHETELFRSRRPDLYSELTVPVAPSTAS